MKAQICFNCVRCVKDFAVTGEDEKKTTESLRNGHHERNFKRLNIDLEQNNNISIKLINQKLR